VSGSATERPTIDQDAHHEDLVTVAIPARNEQASIEALLDSVRSQTHSRLQILVVDLTFSIIPSKLRHFA
jgi:cellulose synthase/poly-beta-1,6-N-acetylglucosamine synthase-like glycosyltransferase